MIDKVSAFILRPVATGSELLIFEHPYAGMQIPAGTVELGEEPEDAVLRKAREETGLKKLSVVKKLGMDHQFTGADEAILTQTMRCLAWPAATAQRIGPLFTRGMHLQTFERKVGFIHIQYKEFDGNQKPVISQWDVDGWLPSEFLTREFVRHFFLLACEEESTQDWSHQGDGGSTYHLRWVALQPHPILHGSQGDWLRYLENR